MRVKGLILLFLIVGSAAGQNKPIDFFELSDRFFKTYVIDYKVAYREIEKNQQILNTLSAMIGDIDFTVFPEDRQLAFLINTYNILVIKSVVENYPISSPMDVPGFFDTKEHLLGGERYTLNEIENQLIREQFKDARIHFVLVCAAVSCPPIVDFSFRPDKLDQQLEQQTRKTLQDGGFIRMKPGENKVLISEIFKWYHDDFLWNAGSVRDYINKYRQNKIPSDFETGYYTYDWSLNEAGLRKSGAEILQEEKSKIKTYTPSKLLRKNQFELQLFNNVYTQTAYRNGERERVETGTRDTYYTGLFYFLYGLSQNARLNLGIDVQLKSVRIDSNERSSPFKVFSFAGPPVGRTALTGIGPKIKFNPSEKLKGFSIQSTFWFPLANNPEGENSNQPWLDYNMYTWWNQFFYDKALSDKFQLFAEIDLLMRFSKDFDLERTHFHTPLTVFLSYFPSARFTVYLNGQYAPSFMKERAGGNLGNFTLTNDYAQAGLGAKWQITSSMNIELSYSDFFTSMNGGAGRTYNLGIRYIR